MSFILAVSVLSLACSAGPQLLLLNKTKKIKPGKTAVLCYSLEDKFSMEFTRQITQKLHLAGIDVLSMDQVLKRFPIYPHKFFLDMPLHSTFRRSGIYEIPKNNMEVLIDTHKHLKTDYLLVIFLDFTKSYSSNSQGCLSSAFITQAVFIECNSYLLRYSDAQRIAYINNPFNLSQYRMFWSSLSMKSMNDFIIQSIPELSEEYANIYAAEIRKYSE